MLGHLVLRLVELRFAEFGLTAFEFVVLCIFRGFGFGVVVIPLCFGVIHVWAWL